MKVSKLANMLPLLTIGLFLANSALAGPDCNRKPDHPSCSGGGGGGGGSDTVAPADVGPIATDAITNAVTLRFVAPGDDGMSGTAAAYDIRISTSLIDDSNFDSVPRDPWSEIYVPKSAGTVEYWTVRELVPGTDYYVAVKALDEAGNESGIQTAAITTSSGSPPSDVDWSIETVENINDYDNLYCCDGRNLAIDGLGNAHATYILDGISDYPNAARYATRPVSGGWSVEEIGGPAFFDGSLAREFDHGWLQEMSLTLNPAGNAEVIASGLHPGDNLGSKGNKSSNFEWTHMYSARQSSGDWSREIIAYGAFEPGGIIDGSAALAHVPGGSGSWTTTAAFVTWPVYDRKTRVAALTIAERTSSGNWTRTDVFQCDSTLNNPYISIIGNPLLKVDSVGRLHFVTTVYGGPVPNILIGGYRDSGSWNFYTTGELPGQIVDFDFTLDGANNPILAVVTREDAGQNLYLVEGTAVDSVAEGVICSNPGPVTGLELVDSYLPDSHDQGNMVDESEGARIGAVMFDADGLYVAELRFQGGADERRLLARCSGSSTWIRDPVDRSRSSGVAALDPDGNIGWAYNLGDFDGPRFSEWEDPMYFAMRTGTPCQSSSP